jgi:hypothetical protein
VKLWSQIALVARLETRFYLRQPKLVLAALAVALIPAIYVLIYLASVWDPAAHTGALPVALVNLDRDVHYRDQVFNLGARLRPSSSPAISSGMPSSRTNRRRVAWCARAATPLP